MIRLAKCLVFCASSILALEAFGAENRIINIVECKVNENMTIDDVQEANGRWVRYMNKTVPGGDIRSFVVRTVVGDWTSFKYIDSFPNLVSWSAMSDAEDAEGKEISEIVEALQKVSTCSSNTLHRAEESE